MGKPKIKYSYRCIYLIKFSNPNEKVPAPTSTIVSNPNGKIQYATLKSQWEFPIQIWNVLSIKVLEVSNPNGKNSNPRWAFSFWQKAVFKSQWESLAQESLPCTPIAELVSNPNGKVQNSIHVVAIYLVFTKFQIPKGKFITFCFTSTQSVYISFFQILMGNFSTSHAKSF